MGKTKTDDKSVISGISCKTEFRCKEDVTLSAIVSSVPTKNRRDDVKFLKSSLNDEVSASAEVKGADVSRTRENSRSLLRKITRNNAAKVDEIFTTKVPTKETVRSGRPGDIVLSKSEIANSKRRMHDVLAEYCSDDEQPTSKRLKHVAAVRIHRLNSAEPVQFSLSDKNDKAVRTAKIVLNNTDSGQTESKCKSGQPEPAYRLKDESSCHWSLAADNQKPDTFKVKQRSDCGNNRSANLADVAGAKHDNEKASGEMTMISEELKFAKQSPDSPRSKCCRAEDGITLMEDRQSQNATVDDTGSNDVVLLVESSCPNTAKISKNDTSRKQSETHDIRDTPIKCEPCVNENAEKTEVTAPETRKVDEQEFVHNTPSKMSRTSSKNSQAGKKSRPAKSKQSPCPGSGGPPSILTRSMIKIPGYDLRFCICLINFHYYCFSCLRKIHCLDICVTELELG